MPRGPKPKPVEQRIREGNPGRRPLPEPVLMGGRPDLAELAEPPENLPEDGKDAWRTIVPTLIEVGMLDRVDSLAIEAMCTAWARFKQAQRVIAETGHIARGAGGHLVEHPSMATERHAYRDFLKYAEHFGLTPTARTRLGMIELQRRSLKDELQSGMGEVELEKVS